jgi:hypothetical protein
MKRTRATVGSPANAATTQKPGKFYPIELDYGTEQKEVQLIDVSKSSGTAVALCALRDASSADNSSLVRVLVCVL